MTKVSNNIENVNLSNQNNHQNNKFITKKKSKLQYNEPIPTVRLAMSIQTPQKCQNSNSNAWNSNYGSVANKKTLVTVDEKKINMTAVSIKSAKNLHLVSSKNHHITKSTKK